MTTAVEHDWTGRQYESIVHDQGQRLSLVAWSDDGQMPRNGDYLILRNGQSSSRYRVDRVHAALAEGDVHSLQLTFAPRGRVDA